MKPILLLLAVLALGAPAAALAKGPSAASIDGPGTGGGIEVKGNLAPESPLFQLSERAGFFPAVFRQTPDPMRNGRPQGELGPKYTVTYTVPGPEGETFTLRQDLYPYAQSPVTYMEPGQKVYRIETRGGWFVAGPRLKDTLVSAGLPRIAPSGSSSGEDSSFSTELLGLLAGAALLLATGVAILLRRRARPVPAA
jgi:hypothetical protein